MYEHFLSGYDTDNNSMKCEEYDEITGEFPTSSIKPRKTKFAPQSFHSCEFCGKWYRSKTSLGLHKRLECGKEPAFQCPYCPLKTHQKGNLQVHIKKKHSTTNDQSLKNKNPILAHELGMISSLNPQNLGINREVSSELTITRTQPMTMNRFANNKTPNLSHLLSQPNKARGITRFPLTAAEITAAAARQNDCKVRVKALANLPSEISVTRRTSQESISSELTITPSVGSSPRSPKGTVEKSNEHKDSDSLDGPNKQTDLKKLPELTRILNSQAHEPVSPKPVILETFSFASGSNTSDFPVAAEFLEEGTTNSVDKESVKE